MKPPFYFNPYYILIISFILLLFSFLLKIYLIKTKINDKPKKMAKRKNKTKLVFFWLKNKGKNKIKAALVHSDGCKLNQPKLSQREEPRTVSPIKKVNINNNILNPYQTGDKETIICQPKRRTTKYIANPSAKKAI